MTPADALLREIAAWCAATGSTEAMLGRMLLNHGGFVSLLRRRGTLKPETDARVRAFMAYFPDAERLPKGISDRLYSDARAGNFWTVARHDALMRRYGFPWFANMPGRPIVLAEGEAAPTPQSAAPTGAGKPKIKRDVIRAAAIDGRDLSTFVTALIDMGLECWRDDRILAGEAVA